MTPSRRTSRDGTTLLELLVVIGIMLVLIGLSAAILPALRQKNNSTKAAGQVQGWLSIAKQTAIRDRAPRGVRLIRASLNPADPEYNLVRSLQYVEVPDPGRFSPLQTGIIQPFLVINQDAAGDFDKYTVTIQNTSSTWDTVGAQPGDYLMVSKNGNTNTYFFEIQSYTTTPAGSPQVASLTARSGLQGLLNPPSMAQTKYMGNPESEFMVIRRARPLVGEQALQLAANTAIDLRYCAIAKPQILPPNPPGTPVKYAQLALPLCLNSGYEGGQASLDILFSADGEMLGTVTDKIVLCVNPDAGKAGAPTLIAVYARTGAIILQPPGVNALPDLTVPANAPPSQAFDGIFSFTEDGTGSGY